MSLVICGCTAYEKSAQGSEMCPGSHGNQRLPSLDLWLGLCRLDNYQDWGLTNMSSHMMSPWCHIRDKCVSLGGQQSLVHRSLELGHWWVTWSAVHTCRLLTGLGVICWVKYNNCDFLWSSQCTSCCIGTFLVV